MAVIFEDTFTEGTDVALTAHTPSPTGTSWVVEFNDSASVANVVAATDKATPSGTVGSTGWVYTGRPNPTNAEYDVEVTIDVNAIDDPIGPVARFTAISDFYALRCSGGTTQTKDIAIYKRVASTNTELATFDGTVVDADAIKFEVRDATKKGYQNATERVSTTDNALTSAGSYGLFWGGDTTAPNAWVFQTGDDVQTGCTGDNFKVTEVDAPGGTTWVSWWGAGTW